MHKPEKSSSIATKVVELATDWLKANTKKRQTLRQQVDQKKKAPSTTTVIASKTVPKKTPKPESALDQLSKRISLIARFKKLSKTLKPSPERQALEEQISAIDARYLKKGTPGFKNGLVDFNSEYTRLVRLATTAKTEAKKGSETYKKRLEIAKLALDKYKLPKRFLAILFSTMHHESRAGRVMINADNPHSSATGVGQFLWSTWKKFLNSTTGDPYYDKIKEMGYQPNRTNDVFVIHAMAWHFRRSVDYLKTSQKLTEEQALQKMTPERTYLTYHDGDKGTVMVENYVQGGRVNQNLLQYNFQRNYKGRFDPEGRTTWILSYAGKVGKMAREKYSEFLS